MADEPREIRITKPIPGKSWDVGAVVCPLESNGAKHVAAGNAEWVDPPKPPAAPKVATRKKGAAARKPDNAARE